MITCALPLRLRTLTFWFPVTGLLAPSATDSPVQLSNLDASLATTFVLAVAESGLDGLCPCREDSHEPASHLGMNPKPFAPPPHPSLRSSRPLALCGVDKVFIFLLRVRVRGPLILVERTGHGLNRKASQSSPR